MQVLSSRLDEVTTTSILVSQTEFAIRIFAELLRYVSVHPDNLKQQMGPAER